MRATAAFRTGAGLEFTASTSSSSAHGHSTAVAHDTMDPSMDDPMSEETDDEELPSGSGSGGKGVVVEGVEIAEDDVYAYGDPDDPLDRVLDVYLADELEDHL